MKETPAASVLLRCATPAPGLLHHGCLWFTVLCESWAGVD